MNPDSSLNSYTEGQLSQNTLNDPSPLAPTLLSPLFRSDSLETKVEHVFNQFGTSLSSDSACPVSMDSFPAHLLPENSDMAFWEPSTGLTPTSNLDLENWLEGLALPLMPQIVERAPNEPRQVYTLGQGPSGFSANKTLANSVFGDKCDEPASPPRARGRGRGRKWGRPARPDVCNANHTNWSAVACNNAPSRARHKRSPGSVNSSSSEGVVRASLTTRANHNQIEKNYRARLKKSLVRLQTAIMSSETSSTDSMCDNHRSLTKGDLLDLARRKIVKLGEENMTLKDELNKTRIRLASTSWE